MHGILTKQNRIKHILVMLFGGGEGLIICKSDSSAHDLLSSRKLKLFMLCILFCILAVSGCDFFDRE